MRRAAGLLAAFALIPAASATVPIRIAASGHATVPVDVPGQGAVPFVFDIGAQGSAVYRATADAWKLKPAAARMTLVGQTGAAELEAVTIPTLALDGEVASDVMAVVLPPRADGAVLNGIVGLDVFGGRLLDFDLPRRQLGLYPAGSDGLGIVPAGAMPVAATRLASGLLTVPVSIGGREGVAVIDTGARTTRTNGRFAALLSITARTPGFAPGETIRGATDEPVVTLAGTVADVRLGGVRMARAPVLVADLPVFQAFGVADRPAAILGLDWLENNRLIIDSRRCASGLWASDGEGLMQGQCHCGRVSVRVPGRPRQLNQCNCSVCWKLGTMWGYYGRAEVEIAGETIEYVRADVPHPTLAFPFCGACGATIAWTERDGGRDAQVGVNMRLFDPGTLNGVKLTFGDGRNRQEGEPSRTYRPDEAFDGAGA